MQGLAAGSVEFEVELLGFEKEAHQEMLSGADKLERAARLKDQGNQLFKQARSQQGGVLGHDTSRGLFPCPDQTKNGGKILRLPMLHILCCI